MAHLFLGGGVICSGKGTKLRAGQSKKDVAGEQWDDEA